VSLGAIADIRFKRLGVSAVHGCATPLRVLEDVGAKVSAIQAIWVTKAWIPRDAILRALARG
jgi:hypothetical protein